MLVLINTKKLKGGSCTGVMPALNVLNCGAMAHYATSKNSPAAGQFGRLLLHFAKRHNVSAMIRTAIPRCNCRFFIEMFPVYCIIRLKS